MNDIQPDGLLPEGLIELTPERLDELVSILKPILDEVSNRDKDFKERAGHDWEGKLEGYCPVQGKGLIDGHPWYFRARWDDVSLAIAENSDDDPIKVRWEEAPGWYYDIQWGGHAEASWIEYEEAWHFIEDCFNRYRKGEGYYARKEKEGTD